ncbi:hypothetical protein [Streptomyces sp. NPDC059071]|uniref:hypothetical protein n=1 Tax=unclassified Streptomyces TaxID=2593676 RepID=UPI003624C3D2
MAAATAIAAAAVFTASGTGLAEGLGAAAPAAESVDGGDTVGVSVGTTAGETSGETTAGGETIGGTTTGGVDGGTSTGGTVGGGETSGGGEPTSTPTPDPWPSPTYSPPSPTPSPSEPSPTPSPSVPPGAGDIPATAYACWATGTPITGTFVGLVPAGTLPTGNKATLVELRFVPKTDPATGMRADDEIVTRFAPAGGAWTAAEPVKLQLQPDGIKPFRPVVDGAALKMPEIRLADVNCWDSTLSSIGGTVRFGGEGGNGGVEVKVPVTWYRS